MFFMLFKHLKNNSFHLSTGLLAGVDSTRLLAGVDSTKHKRRFYLKLFFGCLEKNIKTRRYA
jgi:hypothetical protein